MNDGAFGTAGTGTCSACGAPLLGYETFCTQCGADLRGQQQGSGDVQRVVGKCAQCGQDLLEGDNFCIYCGIPVPAQPAGSSIPGAGAGSGAVAAAGASSANPGMAGGVRIADPLGDDDHPTARPKMVRITYDEAKHGCRKTITVDDQSVTVDIPAGVGLYTKLDVPNLGYYDQTTGERGPLRLSFRIV